MHKTEQVVFTFFWKTHLENILISSKSNACIQKWKAVIFLLIPVAVFQNSNHDCYIMIFNMHNEVEKVLLWVRMVELYCKAQVFAGYVHRFECSFVTHCCQIAAFIPSATSGTWSMKCGSDVLVQFFWGIIVIFTQFLHGIQLEHCEVLYDLIFSMFSRNANTVCYFFLFLYIFRWRFRLRPAMYNKVKQNLQCN